MKKKLALLLMVLMSVSVLAACGDTEEKSSRKDRIKSEKNVDDEDDEDDEDDNEAAVADVAVAADAAVAEEAAVVEEIAEAEIEQVEDALYEEVEDLYNEDTNADEDFVSIADTLGIEFTTLEEYLNNPIIKQQYDSVIEAQTQNDMFTDIKIYAEGNHMVMEYYIASAYADAVAVGLQAADPSEALDEAYDSMYQETGLTDITMTIGYYSEDGTPLGVYTKGN